MPCTICTGARWLAGAAMGADSWAKAGAATTVPHAMAVARASLRHLGNSLHLLSQLREPVGHSDYLPLPASSLSFADPLTRNLPIRSSHCIEDWVRVISSPSLAATV